MPRSIKVSLAFCVLAVTTQAADFLAPFNTEKSQEGFVRADDAVAGISLPPGFRAQVFAAEPDVQQPIAMTTDPRGRIWVAENYTYAERPTRWETRLRDRIVIFADRDGDGRADQRTIFWDEGKQLTSIEVGFGGVWALCPPQLLFIPDRNGDDVPDGPAEVVLDGFSHGASIGHNIANGLKWGPDGWLYGRHGILDTSAVGPPGATAGHRVLFNCAIWRYHPTRKLVEVVSHGGTNSWGSDFDQHGQMFYTNTVIGHLWHVIPGAYYRRMFGAHLNPYVYEVIEQTADHFHWNATAEKWNDIRAAPLSALTDQHGGGHVHIGCLIYQGGTWPAPYRHALLTCNLQGQRVNVDTLHRDGCGYTARHAPDLLRVRDKWFRGVELITGPDGNVFIADWSDTGECHDNDGVHRTSGRIYKISYGAAATHRAIDLQRSSNAELVAFQSHQNAWHAHTARRILQERAAGPGVDDNTKAGLRRILHSDADIVVRLRVLWCLHAIAAIDEPGLRHLLDDPAEHMRVWAVRLLSELAGTLEASTLDKLAALARNDASGLVRLFLAASLQRIGPALRWPIAVALAGHGEDSEDRQQSLMIWYGVEPALLAVPARAVELALTTKVPLVRRLIARRLGEEIERQPQWINRLIATIAQPGTPGELRADILTGLSAALRGLSHAPKPTAWDQLAASLEREKSPEKLRQTGRELSLLFGSGRAEAELLAIVRSSTESANARRNALQSLARNPKPEYLPLFKEWTRERELAAPAAQALARYDDPGIPALLLGQYKRLGLAVKNEVIETLISRPAFARVLLDEIAAGRLPRTMLTPYQVRHIRNLGDATLSATLARVWGELRESPAAQREEMSHWQRELSPAAIAAADPSRGRLVFTQRCAACHTLHGVGGALGPDLTGSDRRNLAYLLENIVDPGAVVPRESQIAVLKLRDGRVLSGMIAEQSERTLLLQTPVERMQLLQSDVLEMQRLPNSLMPEGLLQNLPAEQVRDLFAYLMSEHQVEISTP